MDGKARYLLLAVVGGNVRRHERLADDEAARFVERCAKRIERAVELSGGRLLQMANGEALAVFLAADSAAQAAREMRQRVAELPPQSGVAVALRVGIACAESGVADEEGALAACLDTPACALAARLAGFAQPGQVLLCGATRDRLTPSVQQKTYAVASRAESTAGVYALDGVPPAAATADVRLLLHYAGRSYGVDAATPRLCIGRDSGNDVEVADRRASRRHATLEKRGDGVVLVDHSSNGSYVQQAGQSEVYVRARELSLHGTGVIRFAASAARQDAECVQFEVLGEAGVCGAPDARPSGEKSRGGG